MSTEELKPLGVDQADVIGIVKDSDGHSIIAVEAKKENAGEEKKDSMPTARTIRLESEPSAQFLEAYKPNDLTKLNAQSDGSNPNVHVVVSVVSGTKLAQPFYSNLLNLVLTSLSLVVDVDYSVHYTRSVNTITELTRSIFLPVANAGFKQRIILLSGDGGVVDVINALLSEKHSAKYTPPEIAIIPMGTGNALAHSIGITKDNTYGLSTLARGTPKPLPLFKTTFSPGARLLIDEGSNEEELPLKDEEGNPVVYGAVVTSWGLHAGLVADSDTTEYRKFGVDRFQMAAKEALCPADGGPPHAYKGKISILRTGGGWEPLNRIEHAYVLATLVSSLEKGFMISPASTPLSGKMKLVHFGPMAGDEVMRVLTLAYQNGKHVEEPVVGYEDIEGLKIGFEEEEGRWTRVCVDGKIVRAEKGGWVEVRMESDRVLDVLTLD